MTRDFASEERFGVRIATPQACLAGVGGQFMSAISLRLPDSLHEEIRKLAEREHVSINQLATLAIAEKVAALDAADYLLDRASRADRKKFDRAMAKVADEAPDERDALNS
jgi:hypothetical protein